MYIISAAFMGYYTLLGITFHTQILIFLLVKTLNNDNYTAM